MKILAKDEKWINGYENIYSIDKNGIIKSYHRKKVSVLKPYINKDGYYTTDLSKNKVRKKFLVHRLVGLNFIPNPENKPEINHKNGIKTDNRIENLEWTTRSENELHAYKTGLANINALAEKNSKRVLQIDRKTGNIVEEFKSIRDAEKQTGIWNTSISVVCNKKQKTAGKFIWKFKEEVL